MNKIQHSDPKAKTFLELANRFRESKDPEEIKRLGDELGRLIFGD